MATHSRILAWRISWTEEPDRLQSMGSQELDTTEQLNHQHNCRNVYINLLPIVRQEMKQYIWKKYVIKSKLDNLFYKYHIDLIFSKIKYFD